MTTLIPALLTATIGLLASPGPAAGPPAEPRGSGAWPLRPQPAVVAGFAPPASAFGPGHRGVDLAGSPGQVVHAALGGQVTFAGQLAGRGVVVVSHGDTSTTYEPVRATVRVGDLVGRGAPVGVLALPQSHCLPRACLHWGWLRGETYLDPLALVGAAQVRLKPWAGLGPASSTAPRSGRPGAADIGPSEADGAAAALLAAHLMPSPASTAALVARATAGLRNAG